MKLQNHYFLLRHGEALSNKKQVISCWPEKFHNPLTREGRRQIKMAAEKLKARKIDTFGKLSVNPEQGRRIDTFGKLSVNPEQGRRIDLIFSSDILRTRQTAEIVAKVLKIKPVYDKRLRELNFGVFNGKPESNGKPETEFKNFFKNRKERFGKKFPKGESWNDAKKRMLGFLKAIEKEYRHKRILIISHGDPLWLLAGAVKGFNNKEIFREKYLKNNYLKTGEFKALC